MSSKKPNVIITDPRFNRGSVWTSKIKALTYPSEKIIFRRFMKHYVVMTNGQIYSIKMLNKYCRFKGAFNNNNELGLVNHLKNENHDKIK